MCVVVPYQVEHAAGVVAVVKTVFDEYGFTWEADGYCGDLYDVTGHYLDDGMFRVVLDGERVIGCAGVLIAGERSELHRMYLLSSHRGRGLGRKLLEACLAFARERGCIAMRAWSDVKLTDAHKLYLKTGFQLTGQRICDDPDQSLENGFWKEPL
jgi:putative acetyltransferase